MPSVIAIRDRMRGWFKREPRLVVPRTILVVDNNRESRQSTARLIESLHYQPLQMTTIAEALEHLEQQDPSFVLVGFDLADGQGLDALTQIRALAPDVPIIMLAANVWDPRVAEALRRGAVAYLAPPFGLNALREILGRR